RLKMDNIAPLFLNTSSPIALFADARQLAQTYALFGNVEYDFSDQLTLIGGIRGSKDKKHFEQVLNVATPCAGEPFPQFDRIQPSLVPFCGVAASNVFTDATAGDYTRIN